MASSKNDSLKSGESCSTPQNNSEVERAWHILEYINNGEVINYSVFFCFFSKLKMYLIDFFFCSTLSTVIIIVNGIKEMADKEK